MKSESNVYTSTELSGTEWNKIFYTDIQILISLYMHVFFGKLNYLVELQNFQKKKGIKYFIKVWP
jgi:hypothetical protein